MDEDNNEILQRYQNIGTIEECDDAIKTVKRLSKMEPCNHYEWEFGKISVWIARINQIIKYYAEKYNGYCHRNDN